MRQALHLKSMIKYSLICSDGHRFESWFASADAYETLKGSGMVNCAVCGAAKVEKAMMAPSVRPGQNRATEATDQPVKPVPDRPLTKTHFDTPSRTVCQAW